MINITSLYKYEVKNIHNKYKHPKTQSDEVLLQRKE